MFAPYFEKITPLLVKINPISLWRIKANLLTRTPNIIENTFHIDGADLPEEKLKQLTTSIFYMNTNNGYTEFEDGTKVESVANRFVTFPTTTKHRGTSCTDKKTRVLMNNKQHNLKNSEIHYRKFEHPNGQFFIKIENWLPSKESIFNEPINSIILEGDIINVEKINLNNLDNWIKTDGGIDFKNLYKKTLICIGKHIGIQSIVYNE